MRKRISCKIIKSVPLDAGDDRLRQDCRANVQHPKITDIGTSSYTHRLVVTKTCIDDGPAVRFLDCCA
ncbi:MAG: hypothetical protein ACYSYV_10295 [Planctomycetota bacterium]